MKGLFIFLVVVSILFFGAKLGEAIWEASKKENYHNHVIGKYFKDYALVGYIILLYAFSISLYLSGDYGIEESNFTLIILAIATVLFLGEKVYFSVKNRGQLFVQSNFYHLNELAKMQEMQGVLQELGKGEFALVDKQKFDEILQGLPKCADRKKFNDRLIKEVVLDSLSIVLCVVILVLGLVRGA